MTITDDYDIPMASNMYTDLAIRKKKRCEYDQEIPQLQINPWPGEEETQNTDANTLAGIQLK